MICGSKAPLYTPLLHPPLGCCCYLEKRNAKHVWLPGSDALEFRDVPSLHGYSGPGFQI